MESIIWLGPDLPTELVDLRYDVLRKPLAGDRQSAQFVGDRLPSTLHFAILESDQLTAKAPDSQKNLLGCASLMLTTQPNLHLPGDLAQEMLGAAAIYQLRGMAVAENAQGRGIGSMLLQNIHQFIDSEGTSPRLWCNARQNAIPFYSKHGWGSIGPIFEISNVGWHAIMFRK